MGPLQVWSNLSHRINGTRVLTSNDIFERTYEHTYVNALENTIKFAHPVAIVVAKTKVIEGQN